MRVIIILSTCFLFFACQQESKLEFKNWQAYDQASELEESQNHEKTRMHYKLIQSKFLDKNALWKKVEEQLGDFSESDYQNLKPLILEADMTRLQLEIGSKQLTYEQLTKWYLYRIVKFENAKDSTLNCIIDINPKAVEEAIKCDNLSRKQSHKMSSLIFGMPLLLKDNINTSEMNTTAGAQVLKYNQTENAFIVEKLKSQGAIILGKANLSEWAYFFCSGCPVGYSAIGGQTLNAYGRKKFETGGSSSGSGVAVSANYAVAAVGTETSGSILSPSSQNSVVGLKPTIGRMSRSGIVPISNTLDTPGPMTKSVLDNAILYSAMLGLDTLDKSTHNAPKSNLDILDIINGASLKNVRLGAFESLLLEDSIYKETIEKIKLLGAEVIEIEDTEVDLNGFISLLNIDMRNDLPKYLESYAGNEIAVKDIQDIINYNLTDTLNYMPYGQKIFEGIMADTISAESFKELKLRLQSEGRKYFDLPMEKFKLHGILSINNYHAGYAAVAKYPCLTVPMGYKDSGEPISLTFIAKSFQEDDLYKWALAFEKENGVRTMPANYR